MSMVEWFVLIAVSLCAVAVLIALALEPFANKHRGLTDPLVEGDPGATGCVSSPRCLAGAISLLVAVIAFCFVSLLVPGRAERNADSLLRDTADLVRAQMDETRPDRIEDVVVPSGDEAPLIGWRSAGGDQWTMCLNVGTGSMPRHLVFKAIGDYEPADGFCHVAQQS